MRRVRTARIDPARPPPRRRPRTRQIREAICESARSGGRVLRDGGLIHRLNDEQCDARVHPALPAARSPSPTPERTAPQGRQAPERAGDTVFDGNPVAQFAAAYWPRTPMSNRPANVVRGYRLPVPTSIPSATGPGRQQRLYRDRLEARQASKEFRTEREDAAVVQPRAHDDDEHRKSSRSTGAASGEIPRASRYRCWLSTRRQSRPSPPPSRRNSPVRIDSGEQRRNAKDEREVRNSAAAGELRRRAGRGRSEVPATP